MNQLSWKVRIGVTLSVLWLIIIFALGYGKSDFASGFAVLGLAPVIFAWGLVWVIRGFQTQRRQLPETPADDVARRAGQKRIALRWIAGVVLAVVGLTVAAYSVGKSGNGAYEVGRVFGACLLPALIVAAIWSASTRHKNAKKGYTVLVVGLVYLLGGGYDAYQNVLSRKKLADLVESMLSYAHRAQNGNLATRDEVLEAHFGEYEPLMLAMQAYYAAASGTFKSYQHAIDQTHVEQMMSTAVLESPSGLTDARRQLNQLDTEITDDETAFDSAATQYSLAVKSADLPPDFKSGFMSTAHASLEGARLDSRDYWRIQRAVVNVLRNRIDLLEQKRGRYVVSHQNQILFRDQATLDMFNHQASELQSIAQQEAEWRQRVSSVEGKSLENTADLLTELKN